ncbi:MAG: LamG-like jellyroll fold domain-containing protein [Thermoguttaceae bacterium]|jgi:hypothetical protein|nr:LamG-like jellyroll fold domain-containing protein [Thermoguttaceae bacterium]
MNETLNSPRLLAPLLAATLLSLPAAGAAEGPVFHFNFADANSKSEFTDTTGKVHCKSEGPPLLVEHGALRLAFGARITIHPDEGVPASTHGLTVSAWILKSGNNVYPILVKGVRGKPIHFLFTVRGPYPAFYYGGVSRGLHVAGSVYGADYAYAKSEWAVGGADHKIRIGRWTHVAATFDQGEVTAYIDGKPTARMKAEGALRPNDQPFYIGAERVAGQEDNLETADMLLNDLRLYDAALDTGQIEQIYQQEKDAYPAEPIALKTSYHYLGFGEEFDPDFERVLPITKKYLESIPENTLSGGESCCRIQPHNGALTIFTNDEPQAPLVFHPRPRYTDPERKHKFCRAMEDFAAAGIEIVTTGPMYASSFWPGPGEYDFTHVDDVCRDIIKAQPAARIVVMIYLGAPPWWYKEHPEHKEQYYQAIDGRWVLNTWHGHAPMSSDRWLADSLEMLRRFVKHVESSDYAGHVIGYLPGGGGAAEWYWPACHNGLTGYSSVTEDNFREWLRTKYGNDTKALQEAWKDDLVTFDSAAVPTPEQRLDSEHFDFRDPAAAGRVFDFCRYINERTAHCILATCRTIKEAAPPGRIVGIYHGYALIGPLGKGANSGYSAYETTCRSEWIDFFINMPSYSHEYRGVGATGLMINGFNGTAALEGKLLLCENDLRTHFYEKNIAGRTKNLDETLSVIERGVGLALTRNTAQWWYNLTGYHMFHQQEVMQRIAELKVLAHRAVQRDRQPVAEVALVYDIKSMYYHRYQSSPFRRDLYYNGIYCEAGRMGAPFDVYMTEDLGNPKMPDYKLYIFANQFHADPETRETIARKVRRNNAVAVWCYAPGYISPEGFSAGAMERLTGMAMAASESEQELQMTASETGSPIAKYFTQSPAYTIGPIFKVADPQATILGATEFGPALAIREFDAWRSVYCLMPPDRDLLRGLCEYAGVHVYCTSGDTCTVNAGYLMLHTSTAGEKQIVLPGARTVCDALTGEIIGKNISSFKQTLPENVTRIYELSLPEAGQ